LRARPNPRLFRGGVAEGTLTPQGNLITTANGLPAPMRTQAVLSAVLDPSCSNDAPRPLTLRPLRDGALQSSR
jgi:hypothetical protein